MQISKQDIDLIRHSFSLIALEKEKAGELFYAHLFEIAPETRVLFKSDMSAQAEKLMNTLGFFVLRLDVWGDVQGDLQALAARHVDYGVKPEHYDAVRQAVLAMVKDLRGPGLTKDEIAAWETTYDAVADAMIASAY